MTIVDAYDLHMLRLAKRGRKEGDAPILVRSGHGYYPATLIGWNLDPRHGGHTARVAYPTGAHRTVRQADIILPEEVT